MIRSRLSLGIRIRVEARVKIRFRIITRVKVRTTPELVEGKGIGLRSKLESCLRVGTEVSGKVPISVEFRVRARVCVVVRIKFGVLLLEIEIDQLSLFELSIKSRSDSETGHIEVV